jgi:hypothetical protein
MPVEGDAAIQGSLHLITVRDDRIINLGSGILDLGLILPEGKL